MKIHNPPMQFKNDEAKVEWELGLEKNKDPYGRGVYCYASEWATRMEQAFKKDHSWEVGTIEGTPYLTKWIKENAERISHEADTEGITGYMYGCAVSVLSSCWVGGEELRRWHNLDSQIGDEGEKMNKSGEVLNPAILVIGTKS